MREFWFGVLRGIRCFQNRMSPCFVTERGGFRAVGLWLRVWGFVFRVQG